MKPLPLISVRKRRLVSLRWRARIRSLVKTVRPVTHQITSRFYRVWQNPRQKKRLLLGTGLTIFAFTVLSLFFFWPSTPEKFTFNPLRPGYVSAHLPAADMLVEARTSGTPRFTLSRNNSEFEFRVPGENTVLTSSDNGSLTFRNALNHEVRYQLQSNGIKEEIKLFEKTKENTFSTQIRVNNVSVKVAPNGALYFYSPDGEYQFHVEAPFAQDATGNITWGVTYQILDENGTPLLQPLGKQISKDLLSLQAIELHEDYELQVVVNPQWLQAKERQYPIIIDPTVVHDTNSEFVSGTMDRTSFAGLSGDANNAGHWALNETSNATCSGGGDACDTSGNSRHLTQANTTIITTGQNKGEAARTFNGSTSSLTRTSAATTTLDNWTLEAWVKPTTLPQASIIVFNGNDAGGYGFGISDGTGSSGSKLTGLLGTIAWIDSGYTFPATDVWYHVIMTRKDGTTSFYVNGNPTSGTSTSVPIAVQSRFTIGMQYDAANAPYRYYSGAVDDVTILSRGITPTDALNSYATGIKSTHPEQLADAVTVGLWHMNETSNNSCSGGQDICDSTQNGYHGTENGGPTIIPGNIGNARQFDGTDDFITHSLPLNKSEGTIAHWVNPNVSRPMFTVYESNGTTSGVYNGLGDATSLLEIHVGINIDGNWNFYYQDGTQASESVSLIGGAAAINTWSYVAATWDTDGFANLYVNGKLMASASMVGKTFADLAPSVQQIGRTGDATTARHWSGGIDEVRIDNVARPSAEIATLANIHPSAIYTSPVIDLTSATSLDGLSWTETGVGTGDGETLADATNLVAQWNFNNTSGTTSTNNAGSCGATCNGILTNFASTGSQDAAPRSGWTSENRRWGAGALMFDGTNDYVSVADTSALDVTSAVTIESWFKYSAFPSGAAQSLVRKDLAYTGLQLHGDNVLKCGIWPGGSLTLVDYESTNNLEPGRWYHAACTYDGTQVRTYLDGQLKKSAAATGTIANSTTPMCFGTNCDSGTPTEYSSGILDSVRVYSRSLSAGEIAANAQAGNIQFQTRTSADGSTWEAWKPTTNETQVLALDSDATNWNWASTTAALQGSKTDDSVIKTQGTSSLRLTTSTPQTDANTTGLWHFEETGGTGAYIKDSSGNGRHGTPSGTTVANGISGKARDFTSSSMSVPAAAVPTGNQISISFWAYGGSSLPTTTTVFSGVDGSSNRVINIHLPWVDGTVYWDAGNSGTASYDRISKMANAEDFKGRWTYWTFTKNAATGSMKIYLDGELWHSGTGWTRTLSTVTAGTFGSYPGKLDEFQISDVERTDSEISEAYRRGKDRYISRTLSSTDLSAKTTLPFSVAADRPGTYFEVTAGENDYSNSLADSSTKGLWHLEESSGTGSYIQDMSTLANNCSAAGGITTSHQVSGKRGSALYFDGADDQLECGTSSTLDFASAFTVEAWINPNATQVSADSAIVSKISSTSPYNGLMLWYNNNTVDIYVNAGTKVNSGTPIPTDTWTHVAAVWTGTELRLYLNGSLDSSAAYSTAPLSSGETFKIGSYTGSRNFTGGIDEVRASNIARSANDLRQTYEIGNRSHPITIDFGASLDSGNLIAGSGDTTFTINATTRGLSKKGSKIYSGEEIIVRENYNGTEYLAQSTVNTVNETTGAITVAAWDAGSTFPSGGFTVNADVFKWQREYWDIGRPLDSHIDAVTQLSLRFTNGTEGRTVWLDDIRSASDYLTNATSSTITSTAQQYFQYRAIVNSSAVVSPRLSAVSLAYNTNAPPEIPTNLAPTNASVLSGLSPTFQITTTDSESDYLRYKIQMCTDIAMTTSCQIFDQTASQTGWSGQNTQTSTAYTSGSTATYTYASSLAINTTYYWRSYGIDEGGSNVWSNTQSPVWSFTTVNLAKPQACLLEESHLDNSIILKWDDPNIVETGYEIERDESVAGFSSFLTTAANVTSTTDNSISPDNSYQYRVRALLGANATDWCTTPLLQIETGSLLLEGVRGEGLQLD